MIFYKQNLIGSDRCNIFCQIEYGYSLRCYQSWHNTKGGDGGGSGGIGDDCQNGTTLIDYPPTNNPTQIPTLHLSNNLTKQATKIP